MSDVDITPRFGAELKVSSKRDLEVRFTKIFHQLGCFQTSQCMGRALRYLLASQTVRFMHFAPAEPQHRHELTAHRSQAA